MSTYVAVLSTQVMARSSTPSFNKILMFGIYQACTKKMDLNFRLSLSVKQHSNPCSGSPPAVYQDLSTHHDWPVKNAIVDLPIRLQTYFW